MPAIAPPERLEDVCAAAGADVDEAVEAADVGDEEEEAGVVLAVVEASWATPKAKPS
jgi:hypothetical protein